jgi:hypothetical protein
MAVAPDVSINGKLSLVAASTTTPTASYPEIGSVEIALCNYGSQIPKVGGEAVFARVTVGNIVVQPTTGLFNAWLYSNGKIDPAGTYYTVTIKDSNGDVVQVEAYFFEPGEWDLSNMQPFDPGQPPPPLPPLIIPQLLIVSSSATPNFPGDQYTTWRTILIGPTSPTISATVPGNLYTIILVQDATGGHPVTWPANIYNAGRINTDPYGSTIQTFVADSDGSLRAIAPGTWAAV